MTKLRADVAADADKTTKSSESETTADHLADQDDASSAAATGGENGKPIYTIRTDGYNDSAATSPDTLPRREPVDSGEYDPHEHGNRRQPVHCTGAALLLLKYTVGVGILAIPYTFRRVGYLVGIAGTAFVGLLYLHIIRLLLQLEYDLCKRIRVPHLTYVGVLRQSFTRSSPQVRRVQPYLVAIVYHNYGLSNVLFNAVCLVIMAGGVRDICHHYHQTEATLNHYLTFVVLPVTVVSWIPNLKCLLPFAVLTNVLTVVNMAVVLCVADHQPGAPPESRPQAVRDLRYVPQFLAIVVGAFSCTGLVLPLKADMAEPKQFASKLGVLNVSTALVAALYSAFGTAAYFRYGDRTRGNVLSNLPDETTLSVVALAFYTVAVGISFAYSLYVAFDTLWTNHLAATFGRSEHKMAIECALKTVASLLSYLLAVVVPNFELIAALSGSVGVLADIGLPPMLHLVVGWQTPHKFTISKALTALKNCALVGIALLMFFTAFVGSVRDIVALRQKSL